MVQKDVRSTQILRGLVVGDMIQKKMTSEVCSSGQYDPKVAVVVTMVRTTGPGSSMSSQHG